MLDQLGSVIEELKSCVGSDAESLDGVAAMEVYARFAEVERLGAAGKLAAGARVSSTEVWRRGGWRSAADWMAQQSGDDPHRAREGLETAQRLPSCPVVAAGLRAGRLSEAQAHAIVDAAAVRPEAEQRLVDFAGENSLRRLREECRRVRVAAVPADEERGSLHRSRQHRTWVGRDGALCGRYRFAPDAGAEFMATVDARKELLVREARRDGRREPFDAYSADALLELVTEARGGDGRRSQPKTMVVVHVAYEAIARGAVADGEVCEIRGVGPVPLEVARRMAADSVLRILVTKGGQPVAVTPGKRTIPRALRIQLEARDQTCAVLGCDVTRGLQIDHRKDFSLLGPTDLANCARLCRRHHDMKSHLGFRLVPAGSAKWSLEAPDDYRDLEPPDPDIGETVFCNPWTGRYDALGDGGDQLAFAGATGPAP
jgi:hypothetical protein